MYRRFSHRWLLFMAGVGAIAVGGWWVPKSPWTAAYRYEWHLVFEPSSYALSPDLAGVHELEAMLCNRSGTPMSARLSACCGVYVEGTPRRYIRAHECIPIRLRVETRIEELYRGAVFAYVPNIEVPVAMLQVSGRVYESLVNAPEGLLRVPALPRVADVERTEEVCCKLVSAIPGVVFARVQSAVEWMQARLKRSGSSLYLCLQALPGAPEGSFQLDLPCLYRTGGQTKDAYIEVAGEVVSAVAVQPPRLFFGLVPANSDRVVKRVRIRVQQTLRAQPEVLVNHPCFSARAEHAGDNEWLIHVELTPRQTGEVRANLQCRIGNRTVYVVPLSALVVP